MSAKLPAAYWAAMSLVGLIGMTEAIPSPRADAPQPAPKFYAYCIGMGIAGTTPPPVAEQATLLRKLGYDGIALEHEAHLASHLKVLDDAGLQLYLYCATVPIAPAKPGAGTPGLAEAIARLKGRPTTVSVRLVGLRPGDPSGMEPAVKMLQTLGDLAAEAGVRISIYNHVDNWTESVPFAIELVRKTNHPRVGFNFNLCHWLKVDGDKDYRPLLRENSDKLFAVTINGATLGAKTWTNGLIRPLNEGDFDHRPLLATLRQIGYRGPVGLMCYGVPGNSQQHLPRSMKAWRDLQGMPSRSP
jgi:sugar phosphate isomerase/epimerase